MLFNSLSFIIFFPIVVMIYYIIPESIKKIWLLIASYYFYMCWNPKYAILIFISTVITYSSGILIQWVKSRETLPVEKNIFKKLIVAVCFFANLSILFYFKYVNFTVAIVGKILSLIGITISIPTFDVILPVGISFYTFQALSYTMDVYRDEIYAEKNFFRYALFVSFFPQLVAGPIERSKNLLKQLSANSIFRYDNLKEGLLLMIWGYFLKLVLADRIAIFVDTVYGDYLNYGGVYIIIATVLFAIQIYCDFSGYSIIAMGAAKILNIDLMENFNAPYLSISVADFWRNWHISLTSWFKDYLYIPLGGSKKGKVRKYINKLLVFLVSGLWHGASLHYVIWGGLNGIYQIVGEVLMPIRNIMVDIFKLNTNSWGSKLVKCLFTFIVIDFSWIFFRSDSLTDAFCIIKQLSLYNPWIIFDNSLYLCGLDRKNFGVLIFGIIILTFSDAMKKNGICIRKEILKQDIWCRYLVMISAICFILVFGIWGSGYNAEGFIYFQF